MKKGAHILQVVIFVCSLFGLLIASEPARAADIFEQISPTVMTALPENTQFLVEAAPVSEGDAATEQNKSGTLAGWLFALAMGERAGNSCLTCDFVGIFLVSIVKFSGFVFDFFAEGFVFLVPMGMLIWIAYRVIKMVTFGGEDGLNFVKEMAMKLALFAFVYTAFAGTSDRWVWEKAGPAFLDYSLEMSNTLRDTAFNSSSLTARNGETSTPFNCGGVTSNVRNLEDNQKYPLLDAGLEITCVTERAHMVGIASGVAIITTAQNPAQDGSGSALVAGVLQGVFNVFAGFLILAVFAISAVWMIFLLLDVIVEVAIIAALSPLLAAAALWKPTRSIAVKGLKISGGALVTSLGISIISVLSYFLLGNVVEVYNAMHVTVRENFNGLNMTPIPVGNYSTADRVEALREFIARTQETDPSSPMIPMTLATPWFVYICLSGVAIFALGKKMIAMLSQITGMGGQSAMANNGLKMMKSAMMTTGMVAGGMLAATGAAAVIGGPLAAGGLSFAGGLGSAGMQSGFKGAAKFAGGRMLGDKNKNTLAQVAGGAKSALGAGGADEE